MDRFSFEVVIIGAGVIGLAIARHLSESGISVLVVEKSTDLGKECQAGIQELYMLESIIQQAL